MFGNDLLGLSSTISPFNDTQPDDVIKTKSALAQTGHYQVPDFGITPYPDTPMIDGIKKFQQDNGLKVDGVMKPQGPTETALGNQTNNVSTINPFAANKPETKAPKPKPAKIDPLTGLPKQKAPKLKMPTAKQWEQVAEMQKPKIAIVPEGKTVNQRIQSMMSDARYQDKFDTRLRDHGQKQFEKVYTGKIQYDETGKMVQPTPVIAPEEVEPFDPDGELVTYMVSDNSSPPDKADDSDENVQPNEKDAEKTSQTPSYDEETQEMASMQSSGSSRNIESAISEAKRKWPDAELRITGRARTIRTQAELMATKARGSGLYDTYQRRDHIDEMMNWVKDNPDASYG